MATIVFPDGRAWVSGGVGFRAVLDAARDVAPVTQFESEQFQLFEALKDVSLADLHDEWRTRLDQRLLQAVRRLRAEPAEAGRSDAWTAEWHDLLDELERYALADLQNSTLDGA